MNETVVKEKLKEFVCTELLGDPDYPLRYDEPLITGGLIDSFSLAQVGVFVEDTFNIYIPDTDLTVEAMDTIDLMAARIMKEVA
jgi:acyl carrier protein